MVMAAGPFSTSDSMDMTPLHDLLTAVERERPSVLMLVRRERGGGKEGRWEEGREGGNEEGRALTLYLVNRQLARKS